MISPRFPSSPPGYAAVGRDDDSNKVLPQSSDTPPLPPAISSMQRLPPVSLRQPAGSMDQYPGIPNTAATNTAAPLPPSLR